MPKKRPKKHHQLEAPPETDLNELREALSSKVSRTSTSSSAKLGVRQKAKGQSTAPPQSVKKGSFDGAKLALELLEASTTQLLRRKGWFRDVRLRRSADAFLRSSKLFQKASASQSAQTLLEKPSVAELAAYEEELRVHLEGLRKKLGAVPMNESREISLKSSGPGQAIGAKLKGLKKRAVELEKKPRSVIKGAVRKQRKPKKLKGSGPEDAQ
ncbi:unnamed protein product [Durusdinium trenchii]|uniref:Uncharacterized protein n=2 Tax=Durusdinium trenchii TaxID=1381693 RepID=A0ABP0LXC9_9DINO